MKNLLLLLIIFLTLSNCYAQEKNTGKEEKQKISVPEIVTAAFKNQFPNVKRAEWSMEKPGEYEAAFDINWKESSAIFDEKGNLLETETEISESELPQLVKDAIAKNFNAYQLDEFEKIVARGTTSYEVQAKKDGKNYEIVFDENGNVVKNEDITGKEEEND